MEISKLIANASNPRKMSQSQRLALKRSLDRFGDLSGIIFNIESKTLVGGHQRKSVIPEDSVIEIEESFDLPTPAGTVALGNIVIDGEKFRYREVKWDKKTETEALIAANKHSGEWDHDILRMNFEDFPSMDLESIGFDEFELVDLGIDLDPILEFTQILPDRDKDNESDHSYIRKNKGPEYEAVRERLPDTVKRTYPNKDVTPSEVRDIDPSDPDPFSQKKNEQRFVIIIDCNSNDHKKEVRNLIDEIIKNSGATFF